MIVDVTKVKNKIKIGDHLEVFGKNLNLDGFAKVSETSPYDIITSVSERCERVYIN
jgi:alanine racemase